VNEHQALALQQLEDIAEASNGTLRISEVHPCEGVASLSVELTLQTSNLESRADGLKFRPREPLVLRIPPSFPFRVPSLGFRHGDHAGAAHVNWGRQVCLYQTSESEWVPSDGMYGFFARVDWWFQAASLGELDPDDMPLHPPANFPTELVWYVPRVNTPEVLVGAGNWIGWAALKKHSDHRYDIEEWRLDSAQSEGLELVPALLLDQPLAFEYPDTVKKLFDLLEVRGIERTLLNALFLEEAIKTNEGFPFDLIVGSPMRRKAQGATIRQHLSVWRIPSDSMDLLRKAFSESEETDQHLRSFIEWSESASAAWCRVLDDRPEIVVRRDQSTPSAWLQNKTVLLLGAGALGGPIAEHIVRAGANKLDIVDKGIVSPGLLVRQRFARSEIAGPKAKCLASYLNRLSLGCEVTPHHDNAAIDLPKLIDLESIDLIIDATASRSVADHLERVIAERSDIAPLASMCVSAKAKHGMLTLKMPRYNGGPVELARRAKLAVFRDNHVGDIGSSFWPEKIGDSLMQPEPGCSEPTFVGSSSNVNFHAAGLLDLALIRLTQLGTDSASCDFLPSPSSLGTRVKPETLSHAFRPIQKYKDDRHHYGVRVEEAAQSSIDSEIRRAARTLGSDVETGGLMFGEIDDSHRTIWIDRVSGPPSDSEASAERFLCGVEGTAEIAKSIEAQSKGSSKFVGIWHTHPISRPNPSIEDLSAMVRLLLEQDRTPRHVVMLIVGFAASTPQPKYYLYRKRDVQSFLASYPNKNGAPL